MTQVPDRASRQEALAPYEKLRQSHCVVIGVGAVGRQVAMMLAAMGVGELTLWDFDIVEEVNLGPQAYRPDQLGENKARATLLDCMKLNPEVKISIWENRFARSESYYLDGTTVFCCVDSITTRKLIWESAVRRAVFFGDARVAGETIRVLAEREPTANSHYTGTLFDQGEAFVGQCTAKMTVYSANITAGMLVAQFARTLRGMPPLRDQLLSLLAGEMNVEE